MNHDLLRYLKSRVDWSVKARVGVLLTRDKAIEILDALLNECHEDSGECAKCGVICCPLKDPMHFHHDGCPSCTVTGDRDDNPDDRRRSDPR